MDERKTIPEAGRIVTFRDKGCFVCGQSNPIGLHLEFQYDREKSRASGRATFGEEHQGWDGVVHGGILAAVLDDVMAHAILTTNNLAITTHISVTYRDAVQVGEEVLLEGVVTELRPRVARARGVIYSLAEDGSGEMIVRCQAEGTYYLDAPKESCEPC